MSVLRATCLEPLLTMGARGWIWPRDQRDRPADAAPHSVPLVVVATCEACLNAVEATGLRSLFAHRSMADA